MVTKFAAIFFRHSLYDPETRDLDPYGPLVQNRRVVCIW